MRGGGRIAFLGGGIPAQEAWQTPTLLNSWVNLGGIISTAQYFKDTCGIVHIKGIIKDGTIGLTIFILPAGYRPAKEEYFVVQSNGLFGGCYITGAGEVKPGVGSTTWFSISGITFRAV